jgi:transcriptional regulator with XRE-family HTH domain
MDWKALIDDLTARGLTQAEIAEKCGVKQSTVSDLYRAETKEPRYEFGTNLRKLHAKRVQKARASAACRRVDGPSDNRESR